MNKEKLRQEYLEKRKTMGKDMKRALDLEIQSRLLMTDEYMDCTDVLCYVSNENEIDTIGFINAAFANNKRVAVPVTNVDYSLSFYYINSLKELKKGRFGILEPKEGAEKVSDFSSSLCVVPALCCDISGNRVGYGKGCYDRFLSSYDGVSACLSYGDNVLTSIETEKTDVPVDLIVTNLFVKHT